MVMAIIIVHVFCVIKIKAHHSLVSLANLANATVSSRLNGSLNNLLACIHLHLHLIHTIHYSFVSVLDGEEMT